jgi:hypothetical protein
MLSHELCGVLNGIQGMTELLSSTSLDGEQRQLVEAVRSSTRQMHRLIDGINSRQRGVAFLFSPEPRILDGPELLEQAVLCHTGAAKIRRNLILLVIDPQLPQYWFGDPRLLRQIVDNLLGNAIKFTQAGLVLIEAWRLPAGKKGNPGVELRVRDTGIGFSRAASRRIFKPFVQAEPEIGRVHGGSGLGLFICRKITSSLDGQLDCISTPGVGSSFRVLLPDMIEPFRSREIPMVSSLLSSTTCHISVQGDLGRSLEFHLQRLGIAVDSCVGGDPLPADDGFQVEIGLAEPSRGDSYVDHTLLFTPLCTGVSARSMSGIKRLNPPFLASTLGPLLMEMALEYRLEP